MKATLFIIFLCIAAALPAQGSFKRFFALGCAEKRWVLTHPFVARKAMRISTQALQAAARMGQTDVLDRNANGGQVDAFRHALWMALLAAEIGPRKARKLGLAHEKANYRDFRKGKLEDGALADATASEMDLWNNEQGIAAGTAGTPTADVEARIVEMIKAGEMRVIAQDAAGYFLDATGKRLEEEEWKGKWENARSLRPSDQIAQRP